MRPERAPSPPPAVPEAMPADSGTPAIAGSRLLGAWSADGQNFTWLIEEDSILFEIDMLRHPYRLAGDTLLIDRGDPALGIQKTRVLRVTADTMTIEDVASGTSEALLRVR